MHRQLKLEMCESTIDGVYITLTANLEVTRKIHIIIGQMSSKLLQAISKVFISQVG